MTNYTRIDLEQNGAYGVIVRSWEDGWIEGDIASKTEYIENETVFQVLSKIEKDGYTVEMCDRNTGRALRGEIIRIDFTQIGDTWNVKKYPYGWTAKTRPIKDETKPAGFDISAALEWAKKSGWIVREYPGGARAWKGELLPVRDGQTIKRMRNRADKAYYNGTPGDLGSRRQFDLAYDF
jgi:hypothetical protein